MFAVTVVIRVKPGTMDDFMPLMLENARASLAHEPACSRFDVMTDPERPDVVALHEIYDDADGFAAHRETPHYKRFDAATGSMIADKSVLTWRGVVS